MQVAEELRPNGGLQDPLPAAVQQRQEAQALPECPI
jgi:hypothetical protein